MGGTKGADGRSALASYSVTHRSSNRRISSIRKIVQNASSVHWIVCDSGSEQRIKWIEI